MMPAASTLGKDVDSLFWLLVALSTIIMLLVGGLLLVFSLRYRRGSKAKRGSLPDWERRDIEIGWTCATLFTAVFIFWWAAVAQVHSFEIPKKAMEIHVVAKQWMWKLEHADGQREINMLHVPVGVPVRLIMTSRDVIHSFYVPAFRMKQDVLPGRYTQTWFKATRTGTFHLFCTEYCGTDHSRMGGGIIVMPQADYARWTRGGAEGGTLAAQGARKFVALGCSGCHGSSARVRAPGLEGIYNRPQPMAGGGFKLADENYLRDAIMLPEKDVVVGFAPVMPSYQGVADESDVIALIAYLKSLHAGQTP